MGALQLSKGNLDAAYECANLALGLNPQCDQACALIASCHISHGDYSGAEAFVDKCLELAPNKPSMMWTKAVCELYRGDYKNGFDRAKWGRTSKIRWQRFPDKQWNGEKVGTLFVWCEQGHGDVFQFSRFLKDLKDKADNVICEVYPQQLALYRAQGWPVHFIAQPKDGSCPYEFDAHVSMFDLPKYLGVGSPADIDPKPYLKPSDKLTLEKSAGGKVGVVWKGSDTHMNDPQRSIPDEDLGPLLDLPLVSLQRRAECPEKWSDAGSILKDYTQTAAILKTLSLLVTVDTSVAHLAGALGIPTWLIAPTNGEWRWGKEGEKSAWYESVRLIRPTNMKEAVKTIAKELKKKV